MTVPARFSVTPLGGCYPFRGCTTTPSTESRPGAGPGCAESSVGVICGGPGASVAPPQPGAVLKAAAASSATVVVVCVRRARSPWAALTIDIVSKGCVLNCGGAEAPVTVVQVQSLRIGWGDIGSSDGSRPRANIEDSDE